MSDLRLSDLAQVGMPIDRSVQNLLLDDGTDTHRVLLNKLLGSGAGAANSLVFKEEIDEITDDMYASIADGSFDLVHVGMHYTAPSGRDYYMADADYFYRHGDSDMNFHGMLMIEGDISITAAHQSSNVTTGGAVSSKIYTDTLPAHQSELEADFGASHIKEVRILMSNAVTNGVPSGWAWQGKKSFIPNMPMVFGHYLQYSGNTGEMYNGGNRVRQMALFQKCPDLIVALLHSTQARQWWWCDDVASAAAFANVNGNGAAHNGSASGVTGVRRAFLIG